MVPEVEFYNGQKIPGIGFGLWKNKDHDECVQSVVMAAQAGYRHFDSAQVYGNEQFLAEGLEKAGLARSDAFITTKIATTNFLRVEKSFETSLKKLNSEYVDLLLLHFPVSLVRQGAWKHMEKMYKEGKAKSIGVSNYTIKHLEQLLEHCEIKPMVNQVELHVFLQQPELVKFCQDNGIVVEAYSPLAHGQGIDDPELARVGKKYGKTPTQVMLRWCIEVGAVPLPKSTHKERIEENLNVFDFKLDETDMADLAKLERNLRTCWDPTHIV